MTLTPTSDNTSSTPCDLSLTTAKVRQHQIGWKDGNDNRWLGGDGHNLFEGIIQVFSCGQ